MGGCPGHSGTFTSIPDVPPLDDSSNPYLPQLWQLKLSPDIVSHQPLGKSNDFHCTGGRASASRKYPLAHGNLRASVQGPSELGSSTKLAGADVLPWSQVYSLRAISPIPTPPPPTHPPSQDLCFNRNHPGSICVFAVERLLKQLPQSAKCS